MLFEILADTSLTDSQMCDKIEDLVKQDPDILKLRELGTTPLHIAVLRNLPGVVSLLIKLGMSVNTSNDKQQTPLHLAASSGLEDMIWLLGYQPDCDFNLVDSEKKTALHEAVFHAHPECVKNLLLVSRFKLDITLRDKDGHTAADILDGQEIKAQQLLEEAFFITNRFHRTPLHMAVIKNLDKVVQGHLRLGAPINAQDGKGRTALHLAVLSNHPQILLMLCHYDDIDMNAVDIDGWTALHHSVALMNPDCVKILVSAKKSINKEIRNNDQLTANELMQKSREATMQTMADKKGLSKEELEKWNLYKKRAEAVKKWLAWTPVVEFEKEFFSGFEPVHLSNIQVKEFLAKNYSELSVAIVETKTRKISDGYTTKFIKQFRHKTSAFFVDSDGAFLPEEKQRPSLTDSGLGSGVMMIDKPFEKTFQNKNPKLAAKLIKNYQAHFSLPSSLAELKCFVAKNDHELVSNFFLSVIDELQYSLVLEQDSLNRQISGLQTYLQKIMIAMGLKPICQTHEINQLTDDNYAGMSNDENTVLKLKSLTELCSGKPSGKEWTIDLNAVLQDSLGMTDYIEPSELVLMLMQLHPFFSTIQRLQSNCIVFSIVKEYDLYKFDEAKTQQFNDQVDAYVATCCDEIIGKCINDYRKNYLEFKTKSLHFIIENIKSMLIQPSKESILKRINTVVEQGAKHGKMDQDIAFIAREFNMIHAQFYRDLALEEYRNKCWDKKDSKLNFSVSLFDKMQHFIMNTIRSFDTIELQESAIRLFTLVARESLHFQYGADLSTVFVIFCVLNTNTVEKMEAFKSLEKNDKNFVSIKAELTKLLYPSPNFKFYRQFLTLDDRMFPSLSFIYKDKTPLFEMETPNYTALGKIYKSFIQIKKGLQDVSLNSRSDLLDRVAETIVPKDEDIHESNNEIETAKVEGGRLSKSTSKRDISPRNIFKKDPSPRNNNSSEKKPSPRSPLSDSDSSSTKSLHEKKPSPRTLSSEGESEKLFSEKKSSPRQDSVQSLNRSSSERKRLLRKQSGDKQDTSPRRLSVSKKFGQMVSSSSPDIEITTPQEIPVKVESPGRLSLFNNSTCSLVNLDVDVDSEKDKSSKTEPSIS